MPSAASAASAAEDAALPAAILYERVGRVALLTYNRPERRNAWSVEAVQATVAAIKRANADAEVGAIVLTGRGSVFCAGADLKEPTSHDPETGRRLSPARFTMGTGDHNWISLLAGSKPVIFALNGAAVGIGATQTLAGDIRIAARSASFSFPFLKLGAMPECGSSALLPRLIGAGRATDILLRSARVSAEEALQIGLVTGVYPDEELRDAALALGQTLAEMPPVQMQLTKKMLLANAVNADPDSIMRIESDAFVELLRTLKRDRALQPE
ncbi:MAG: enoyl-CoA hydratase/isomerase family protein [Pseudomonadota bacterium]